jgi:hypothetical protein
MSGGGQSGGGAQAGGNAGSAGATGMPAPPIDNRDFTAVKSAADAAGKLSHDEAMAAYPATFGSLAYDPLKSEFLDRIQASALALSDADKALLGKNGFVISRGREFPTFVRGYAELYSEHLPVYVSADAVLESVHSAYDTMLRSMEQAALISNVKTLLQGMRSRLAASSADAGLRADVDVYLAVALSLLQGTAPIPSRAAMRRRSRPS